MTQNKENARSILIDNADAIDDTFCALRGFKEMIGAVLDESGTQESYGMMLLLTQQLQDLRELIDAQNAYVTGMINQPVEAINSIQILELAKRLNIPVGTFANELKLVTGIRFGAPVFPDAETPSEATEIDPSYCAQIAGNAGLKPSTVERVIEQMMAAQDEGTPIPQPLPRTQTAKG